MEENLKESSKCGGAAIGANNKSPQNRKLVKLKSQAQDYLPIDILKRLCQLKVAKRDSDEHEINNREDVEGDTIVSSLKHHIDMVETIETDVSETANESTNTSQTPHMTYCAHFESRVSGLVDEFGGMTVLEAQLFQAKQGEPLALIADYSLSRENSQVEIKHSHEFQPYISSDIGNDGREHFVDPVSEVPQYATLIPERGSGTTRLRTCAQSCIHIQSQNYSMNERSDDPYTYSPDAASKCKWQNEVSQWKDQAAQVTKQQFSLSEEIQQFKNDSDEQNTNLCMHGSKGSSGYACGRGVTRTRRPVGSIRHRHS